MNEDRLENVETLWSLVRRAHASGLEASAVDARRTLVLRYAPAIRRYVAGILKASEDSEEIAQDVIVRLLKGDFAGADPNRGRFRDLLKFAIRNMIRNHWAKQQRRSFSALDLDTLTEDRSPTQDSAWTLAWQNNVLEHAWAALKDSERKKKGNLHYTLLRWRVDFPDETSDQLADRLSEKLRTPVTSASARQMLRRARLRFAELLIEEISLSLDEASPARLEEELASLELLEYVRDFLPPDWHQRGKLLAE